MQTKKEANYSLFVFQKVQQDEKVHGKIGKLQLRGGPGSKAKVFAGGNRRPRHLRWKFDAHTCPGKELDCTLEQKYQIVYPESKGAWRMPSSRASK